MAILNDDGWWIGERLCTGDVDGNRTMTTADTRLSWLDFGTRPLVFVEYTVTLRHKRSSAPPDELRWMRFCGLGQSGKPACTRPALLSCTEEDGSLSKVEYSVKGGLLRLTSEAVPGQACGGHEAFLVGEFEVQFP